MTRATQNPPTSSTLTFEEYLVLPETSRRQEVIDGVVVMSPTPTGEHQWIVGNLYRGLFAVVEGQRLGTVLLAPLDVLIRKQPKLRTRQPDLMFFSDARARREELKRTRIVEVGPDLVIEIRSEGETESRWAEKLADYTSIAVSEVWRVDPDAGAVEVLTLVAGHYEQAGRYGSSDAVRSPLLPGLALPVASIFA
jgi:Uma2 family endonuclease